MKWPWKISDGEFVRRIEKQMRWRPWVAFLWAAMSAVLTGTGGYFFRSIQTGILPFYSDELAQSSFQLGAIIGYVGGKLVFFALCSCFAAVYLFFARRKDRLLVTYHRRLVELGDLTS